MSCRCLCIVFGRATIWTRTSVLLKCAHKLSQSNSVRFNRPASVRGNVNGNGTDYKNNKKILEANKKEQTIMVARRVMHFRWHLHIGRDDLAPFHSFRTPKRARGYCKCIGCNVVLNMNVSVASIQMGQIFANHIFLCDANRLAFGHFPLCLSSIWSPHRTQAPWPKKSCWDNHCLQRTVTLHS